MIQTVIPFISGLFIDSLATLKSLKYSYNLIVIFIVLTFLSIITNYVKNILIIKTENNLINSLISELLTFILYAEYKEIKKYNLTYLTQLIYNDTKSIIRFIVGCYSTSTVCGIASIMAFIMLYRINFVFAIITFLSIPVYLSLLYLLRKKIRTTNFIFKESQDLYVSHINEQINLLEEIKINSLFNAPVCIINNAFEKFYKAIVNSYNLNYFLSIFDTILKSIIQIIFYCIGIYLVFKGKLSVGIFTTISILYSEIITSIKYFFDLIKQLHEIKVSMGRINSILNIRKESVGCLVLNNEIQITINTKKFTYSFCDSKTLNIPPINTKDHGIYLLVGENGSGKTTFLRLLTGLLKTEPAKIYFSKNKDILLLNLYDLRHDFIAYVIQEPVFWNTTVEKNFSIYLEEELTYLSVIRRIKHFELNIFIEEEFFTIELWKQNINELSVGQRKKLMICIQLMRNKKICILDEPNASLDDASIHNLQKVIMNKSNNVMFLIISHDNVYADVCTKKIIFES